jgi:NTP pyrophosphatase (non-canonical NTP hydrolase)
MGNEAVEYYGRKFQGDRRAAFVHLVKEVGELARALEKGNEELARIEITEIAGLTFYFSHSYGFDLEGGLREMYTKKLASADSIGKG